MVLRVQKAIVKIKLVEKMPTSSWMKASPREYGFYSNVNPDVRSSKMVTSN